MRIRKIVLGRIEETGPVTNEILPNASGVTVVETPDDPRLVALAVRETLTSSTRTTKDTAAFVSIETVHGDVELTIADDASSGVRMMTRGVVRAIPEVLEVHESEAQEVMDGALDTIFGHVAEAAGVTRIEVLAPALAHVGARSAGDTSPEARAFLEASSRALSLADAVRTVDDEMTASVVPDWLWIATGLGGVGVFCTAIAFLYPELRVVMVIALAIVSVIGFSLYGWRAFLEMKTRGRLQDERAALRERREAARAEVQDLGTKLAAAGEDPNAILVAHADAPPPATAPAILGIEALDDPTRAALTDSGRQVIVFVAPA